MLGELDKVGIALLDSVASPHVGVVLFEWLHVFLEQRILLSSSSALELLDVVHV